MIDRDSPYVCPGCLHPRESHVADGCLVRDDLGNRCACAEPAHW